MLPRTFQYIADACQGTLVGGDPARTVSRLTSDSRSAQPGDLFVALPGDRFDGHSYLNEVAAKGALVAIVQRDRVPSGFAGMALIVVDDTRAALGRLAARYRLDFALPILAVAGSNGKTTTKELVAAVLGAKLNTLWSEGSFNNDIGVPLTLLRLDSGHQAGAVEIGSNHPGELAPLVRMIRPLYGIITSIGREHLEFFGDLAGVAKEEGTLAELLDAGGKLFLNGDSPFAEEIRARAKAATVRVGHKSGNDWVVRDTAVGESGTSFILDGPDPAFCGRYEIRLLGRHQALNASFAILLGRELGLSREEIQRGLSSTLGAKMRLQIKKFDGFTVLDDAYNANVDSMIAALETLKSFPCRGKRIAVLGEMAELGETSESAHIEVGQKAAQLGIDCLYAGGGRSKTMAEAAKQAGLAQVFELGDPAEAAAKIGASLGAGDAVLVKASRSGRFERIVEGLAGLSGVASGRSGDGGGNATKRVGGA